MERTEYAAKASDVSTRAISLSAVQALQNDRRLYAESLLHVVDYISQRGGRMPRLASGMRPTTTLEERLRAIMNDHACGRLSERNRSFLGGFGVAVLLVHPFLSASPNSMSGVYTVSDIDRTSHPLESQGIDTGTNDPIHDSSIDSQRLFQIPLPEVPQGWWNERPSENLARILSTSTGQQIQLLFNPGIYIDVSLEGNKLRRLAEPAPIAMVALHDATRLIVCNNKGEIRIWDVASQQSVSWIGRHSESVTTLCYHPKFGLLSGDANGLVLQWEIQSGAILNSWSSDRGRIQSIRSDAIIQA